MSIQEKLAKLEETFEADAGSIVPELVLENEEWWDSMGKLTLIVMLDDDFGKKVSGDEIRALQTVQDILNLMN